MSQQRFGSVAAIVAFAIEREIEAVEGYSRLAALAETPGLRELLISLREEEAGHRRLLEGLTPADIDGLAPASAPDLRVIDFLAEEKPGAGMSLQDLLIFAAQKEKKAIELYVALGAMASSAAHKRLFEFLAGQERAHKLRLEAEYENHILPEN